MVGHSSTSTNGKKSAPAHVHVSSHCISDFLKYLVFASLLYIILQRSLSEERRCLERELMLEVELFSARKAEEVRREVNAAARDAMAATAAAATAAAAPAAAPAAAEGKKEGGRR